MAEKKASQKRKTNLLKLYTDMTKLAIDAVDKEVVKRFKIIIDSAEQDITKATLSEITRLSSAVDISSFGEGLQPYVKHYVFMKKRVKEK